MGCIVMACNSGGPLESVADGKTGYLQPPVPEQWGQRIYELLGKNNQESNEKKFIEMRKAAKQRVQDMFIMDVFADSLVRIVENMK